MKQAPILFSTPMVQAILDGRRTQTRRIVKPAIENLGNGLFRWKNKGSFFQVGMEDLNHEVFGILKSGKWQKGDVLWVKETFKVLDYWDDSKALHVMYKDGKADVCTLTDKEWAKFSKWENQEGKKPSLFMFKSLSRIYLQITDIRVERLKDITEDDAIAEGIELVEHNCFKNYDDSNPYQFLEDPIGSFQSLWESINGRESWDANPWVWVIRFKRINKTKLGHNDLEQNGYAL